MNHTDVNATISSILNDLNASAIAEEVSTSEPIATVDPVVQSLWQKADWLDWICAPVIVALGTVGNSLTVLVMQRMSAGQSGSSMAVYFTALAVSDFVILYAGLFRAWLGSLFQLELMDMHDVVCRTFMCLIYMCGMSSSWLLVSMTLQRVTSVMFPHRIGLLFTRRKAQVVVVVIFFLALVLNGHILFTFTIVDSEDGSWCTYNDDKSLEYYDTEVYPWLDLTFTSVLPFTILAVGNSLLVWKVVESLKVARQMTSSGTDQMGGRQKKTSSMTITVISVSVTFFCLTSPICVFLILNPYFSDDARYQAMIEVVFVVCKLLWYLNSAINFYLYCLTGTKFRGELKGLFCRRTYTKQGTVVGSGVSKTLDTSETKVSEIKDDNEAADF